MDQSLVPRKCWAWDPACRPSFPALCGLLQPGNCFTKHHSTSEPRNLDQAGRPHTGLLA